MSLRARNASGRWALSFADLSLLLLGFFVLLQARPAAVPLAAGLRSAFGEVAGGSLPLFARDLFEPGEAVLRPPARARLRAFATGAGAVRIASRGTEPRAARFDGWELAAARTAAIAREMVAAGVAQRNVTIAIDPATGGGQALLLSRH